ncbi:MAG: hypothetical protein OEM64_14095 [Gammaproteobacteria bacterium]|nr:hypothetical protein [Gammaproteobacteria bacterium]
MTYPVVSELQMVAMGQQLSFTSLYLAGGFRPEADARRLLCSDGAADWLDEFLANGFKVLEPDGSVRTKDEEIAWLRETPPDEEKSDFLFTIEEIVFAGRSLRSIPRGLIGLVSSIPANRQCGDHVVVFGIRSAYAHSP